MKALSLVCLTCLLAIIPAQAASTVRATITFTNVPVAANTIVVNGTTKTWIASVTDPTTQILIGANIGANQTNLLTAIGARKFPNLNNVTYSSSNVVVLNGVLGQALSVSFSGSYATVSLSTNTANEGSPIVVPASQEPSQAHATNILSQLVADLGNYPTSSVPANATAFANHVNITHDQTIGGNKTFTGTVIATNSSDSQFLGQFSGYFTGSASFDSDVTVLGDMFWGGAIINNQINQDGSGFLSHNHLLWDVDGNLTAKSFTGNGVGLTNLNASQLTSGTIPSSLLGTISSLTTSPVGTNTLAGALIIPAYGNSALANGNNASIFISTNSYVQISGPSASFNTAGFSGGVDGRMVTVENTSGQVWTVLNQSGIESTAANRVLTMNGADRVISNNVCTLRYDGTASRWKIISVN